METSRSIEDSAQLPQIVIVRHPQKSHQGQPSRRNRLSLWVGTAIFAGVACGLGAVTILIGQHRTMRVEVPAVKMELTQTVVPVTYDSIIKRKVVTVPERFKHVRHNEHDTALEEVRTRNRRLEALVKVLRRRDANEFHSAGSSNN